MDRQYSRFFGSSLLATNPTPFVRNRLAASMLARNVRRTKFVTINLDADRLPKLKAELSAIKMWDSDYYNTKVHHKMDDDSFLARQDRREDDETYNTRTSFGLQRSTTLGFYLLL